ncbi:MAG: homocysteine S-methyltransferase family protein, partial [Candidatus Hydrogenedentes bacterium]|nr:homocysteine S-methyltransferase family protein [Candidatus Hydrogenedentota bacterium]
MQGLHMTFLQTLQRQAIVIDGAVGTMVQARGFTDEDFGGAEYGMLTDLLAFARPESLEEIHVEYFAAGAMAVETNTFGASPFRLSEYDFSGLDVRRFRGIPAGVELRTLSYEAFSYHLSRVAAETAVAARAAYRRDAGYDGRPLFVIGSIGPSNRVLSSTDADLRTSTFDTVSESFVHQINGLIDGGVDVLLFETQQDILELKAGIVGAHRAMAERGVRLPIMAQVTVDQFSRMQIFNTDIHAALVAVQHMGIDTFGINCSIGPDLMGKTVEKLARFSPLPISTVPNAGLPVSENGRTVFRFPPERMAELLASFVVDHGVSIVGGCCGTTPDHIRATVEALGGRTPKPRRPEPGVYVSGPQQAVRLDEGKALTMVGERLNVRGSKKVREAVESGGPIDHAVLEEVVQEQVRGLGVNVIDVCMDSNVVDTTEALKEVVHRQTTDFQGAMSLDSFSVEALAEAVKVYPGRPIINSISLEEVEPGVTKVDAVLNATKQHGPIYVALATGPEGPGATAAQKATLARALVERAAGHGVGPERLFIDMNVFPIGSESEPGANFALESLEAIPLIKAIHPDLRTTCGVGNLTNGLASKPYMRKVLTSVWLDEARKRGLDAAIINPNHYVFVKDLDPGDYELGLSVILERDMEAFEQLEIIAEEKKGHAVVRRTGYDDLDAEAAICQKVVDGFKERETGTFAFEGREYAYSDRIVLQAAEVLGRHEPLEFINRHLMRAMRDLGDGFARGDVSLPHLLKSADVMKQVMAFLEAYMHNKAGVDVHTGIAYKGTIVIGTVYQDVHSIGKDLAKTLFENYGYRVVDLGVMTPLQGFIDAAKEHEADAIGMSALLVQTSNHMITVSKMMQEQGLAHLPVLVGGAPVNHRHAAYVAMAGDDDPAALRPNVFYCPTAMDGVNIMNTLLAEGGADALLESNRETLLRGLGRAEETARRDSELLASLPARAIAFDKHRIPEAPWEPGVVVAESLTAFAPRIDRKTLYGLNWKYGGSAGRERRGETRERLDALLDEWVARADREGWLHPRGVYGIFPAQSDGNDVLVFDPDEPGREVARFSFARVIGAGKKDTICAAQYFRSVDSGEMDAVGLQIATG